ncbi:MAG: glycosyltransferase [Sedimentisphaerales bacterium]|nr:glycosyltransferase [Sedimentisphaerales bacterium]
MVEQSAGKNIRLAIVCDWLTGMRGGERCLEAACQLYPKADIFTLVHVPGSVSKQIESHNIYTSYIQKLPGQIDNFRRYLPLFPNAIKKFDLSDYDIVLSFSHCVAKGAKHLAKVPHICYCFTPMRYAWELRSEYLKRINFLKRGPVNLILDYLKRWDCRTASNVTHFIATSKHIQDRIKKSYNRDSEIIYPPVDCSRFSLSTKDDGYYLVLSALVPYKRIDIAVEAFSDFGRDLLVIGSGPEMENLKNNAARNIHFLGDLDDKQVAQYLQKCTALIFPGIEDFGIAPLEAQACGKGVIAYGKGGVLETVMPLEGISYKSGTPTGIFFHEQDPPALKQAVVKFEERRDQISPQACRNNALRFNLPVFQKNIDKYIHSVILS